MAENPHFNADFEDILRALLNEGAEFLVVGAHALAFHGVVRSTGDLDVFVRAEPENAKRVIRALRAFGAPLESHNVSAADFVRRGTVYQIGLPPNRIDLLTEISGVEYDEARAGSHAAVISGLEFRVPGREHLIRNKRASGRPKDLADARRLELAGGAEPESA